MSKEVWKVIPGFLGYFASDQGRIAKSSPYRILAQHKSTRGYLCVNIRKEGAVFTRATHRLVGFAFGIISADKDMINHIDGVKANNRLSNLEKTDYSSNMLHAYAMGLNSPRTGSKNGRSKLCEEDVRVIFRLSNQGMTRTAIAKRYGVSITVVSDIMIGKLWTHVTSELKSKVDGE